MDSLLEKAAKFLTEHPEVNEIELTDTYGGKVHLIRATPTPLVQLPYNYSYHYPYP